MYCNRINGFLARPYNLPLINSLASTVLKSNQANLLLG